MAMERPTPLRARRPRAPASPSDHSVFSFPSDRSDEDSDMMYGAKKRRSKSNPGKGKRREKKEKSHPYPSSISITVDRGRDASPAASGNQRWSKRPSKGSEFRSPVTSPSRGHKFDSEEEEEGRQPHSPSSPRQDPAESDLAAYHEAGLTHFRCNRLSEAVESYSLALRSGLEELTTRKAAVARLGKTTFKEEDKLVIQLGEKLAQVHIDMGQTLEVAQKYREAKLEWENGAGMLARTCGADKMDERVRKLKMDVARMDRAVRAEGERREQTQRLERAMDELQSASGKRQKEARKGVIGALKKLLRTERDSLGEHSHACAKLRLKLAKARCEGGDLEGGLKDADAALVTLEKVLGTEHTLVGAACLFCAAVYERQASMLSKDGDDTKDRTITPEAKAAANQALERYGDALDPLRFKYDHTRARHRSQATTPLRPDVGEVLHKMALLSSRKGSHASAVDACHRALEAYGAPNGDQSDVSKNKNALREVHPEAALVWRDLASVHLKGGECSDAVYAAERAVELAHQVLTSTSNAKVEAVPVSAYQTAGDAYTGLGRHTDAARAYQEAHREFEKLAESGSKGLGAMESTEKAKILHKLEASLSRQGQATEAGSPSKLVAGTPLSAGTSMATTPQSNATASTYPSTGYSRGSSTPSFRSGHGQLQTLLEELASPEGQNGSAAHEMQQLKSRLEEAEKTAQQYQLRVKEVEAERDQEKKERVFAAAAYRKETDAVPQTNVIKAPNKSEVHALRKELHVTEASYQELVKAIDDEKERIGAAHDAEVRKLEEEVARLQDKLKTAGAVENHPMSVALAAREREAETLRNQGQKLSTQVAKLQSAQLAVQSERDAAARESSRLRANNERLQADLQRVSAELAESKAMRLGVASRKPANDVELKNLEWELQSERSRRQILEATLQKEYDQGPAGGHMAYPMMPFGYPPMGAMGTENVFAKVKTLEIDLATERASKEMLENVITELRSTHEEERDAMESQYSSYVASQQQETSRLLAEVGTKEAEVNQLCLELDGARSSAGSLSRQVDDAMDELSAVKQQLMRTSAELSNAVEDKQLTSEELRTARVELTSIKGKLNQKESDNNYLTEEVRMSSDQFRHKKSERDYLSEENGRLKKEYREAITLFESEMDRIKGERDEVQSTLGNELERLQNEFGTAKLHLQNVLGELEGGNRTIGSLHTDIDHLKLAVDNARADADTKEEELKQAEREIEELTNIYQELEGKFSQLEGIVSREKQARKDKEAIVRETESRLHTADKTIEEVRESIRTLGEVESQKRSLERALQSIARKLEKILPPEVEASMDSAPDDEEESKEARISHMLGAVGDYCKHQKAAAKASESALEKTQWNLTNAANDLDALEAKHKILKEELAELGNLQGEYNELLEQYEIVVEEKENLEESLKAEYLERDDGAAKALQTAEAERDLFESQLKEAVEDLEELESERDSLREEIELARGDFAQKETSMGSMITALETDNKLIEQLEGQALEYEAALSEKDAKLLKLQRELADLSSMDGEEKLMMAQMELEEARGKIKQLQREIDDMRAQHVGRKIAKPQLIGRQCSAPQLTSPLSDERSYPDILPGNAIYSRSGSYADTATNPFDSLNRGGSEDIIPDAQQLLEAEKAATNPFDEENDETAELKARVAALESQNGALRKKLEDASLDDEIELSREREAMVEEIAELKSYIQALEESNAALSAELADCKEEAEVSASLRKSDCEAISILQKELEASRTQTAELQERSLLMKDVEIGDASTVVDTAPDIGISEKSMEEVAKLRDEVDALEEQNAQLSAQLADAASHPVESSEQDALAQQIASLKSHIETLEADKAAMSTKLAQAEATACESNVEGQQQAALEAWQSRATDAEKAHENDQATILSLQNALNEKDELHQADLNTWRARAVDAQEALNEKEKLLQEKEQQEEEEPWKSQVVELKESNAALNRELSELSAQTSVPEDHTECNSKLSSLQIQLENARTCHEERALKHNQELASINAELKTAKTSLDELQAENEKLKGDIESLSSMKDNQESDESKNFEKEMNAAHARFESMENALQERVNRLEKEKNQLIADYNSEIATKDDEHSQTKIELSAWKLEMQNALNDIEGLKKERDSLKEQVEAYTASLEAVVTGKAELEEQVHSLGLGR